MLDLIKKLLDKVLLGKYFGSVVRTGMSAAGGYLVARGVTSPEAASALANGVEQVIVSPELAQWLGASLFGLAQGASLVEKGKRK